MSFESEFLNLMPHTVVRTAFMRRDAYGAPTYASTATTYGARVVASPTQIPSGDGVMVVATHTMWLATTASLAPEDKLSFGGSTFRILEIANFPDEVGAHHVRVRTKGQ